MLKVFTFSSGSTSLKMGSLNVNTKYSHVWYQIKGLDVIGFTIDDLNGVHSLPVPTSSIKGA